VRAIVAPLILVPIFFFDGADCSVYRSIAEAEADLEPPAVADPNLVGYAADGAPLELALGPDTTLPEKPRRFRAAWKGPAEVRIAASGAPPERDELARRLRSHLELRGDDRDELQALGLEALVARAAAAP
jgi:hypothetical protein